MSVQIYAVLHERQHSGVARTATGRHTIAFRVLRQSADTVDYVAEVTLRVTRDGSSQVVTLPLDPARVALQSGQVVSFDVYFQNSLN